MAFGDFFKNLRIPGLNVSANDVGEARDVARNSGIASGLGTLMRRVPENYAETANSIYGPGRMMSDVQRLAGLSTQVGEGILTAGQTAVTGKPAEGMRGRTPTTPGERAKVVPQNIAPAGVSPVAGGNIVGRDANNNQTVAPVDRFSLETKRSHSGQPPITVGQNLDTKDTKYSLQEPGGGYGSITVRGGRTVRGLRNAAGSSTRSSTVPTGAAGYRNPQTGLAISGVDEGTARNFLTRQYAPPQRTVAGQGGVAVPATSAQQEDALDLNNLTFGQAVVQGLRSRQRSAQARREDLAAGRDLQERGQNIDLRGQTLTAATDAASENRLRGTATLENQLIQEQFGQQEQLNSLFDAYQAAPEGSPEREALRRDYQLLRGLSTQAPQLPKIFDAPVTDEFGRKLGTSFFQQTPSGLQRITPSVTAAGVRAEYNRLTPTQKAQVDSQFEGRKATPEETQAVIDSIKAQTQKE